MDFETWLGSIIMVPWGFAPRGCNVCQGQIVQVAQNQALYSLMGNTFGGNAPTTFALPDLRGRAPAGMGQGPNLTNRSLGEQYGLEQTPVSLGATNLPAHTHAMLASTTPADRLTRNPAAGWSLGAAAAVVGGRTPVYTPVRMYGGATPANPVQGAPTSSVGTSEPVPVATMVPSLAINFVIAMVGLYPTRS